MGVLDGSGDESFAFDPVVGGFGAEPLAAGFGAVLAFGDFVDGEEGVGKATATPFSLLPAPGTMPPSSSTSTRTENRAPSASVPLLTRRSGIRKVVMSPNPSAHFLPHIQWCPEDPENGEVDAHKPD
jgi:hypothetical protein